MKEIKQIKENENILCKGIFYKGKVNMFINSNDEYVYTQRMIPLRKMSCKGCEKCGFLLDDLRENISNGCNPLPEKIVHNKIYQLKMTNAMVDYESGYVDDWDIEFIENG